MGYGVPGRWNKGGIRVIYTASTLALATLESLIHRNGYGFNSDFATVFIEIPDDLPITEIRTKDLPEGWNSVDSYGISQELAEQWIKKGETAVLKVPSAVIPDEYNYVINSLHHDTIKIKIVEVTDYVPDPRIEEILKKRPTTG
nr:RES family NAD+ phosphorylase [Chitinophaga polysaccharea]